MVPTALRQIDETVAEKYRVSSRTASNRHVCMSCRERRSLYRYSGGIRADRDHTLSAIGRSAKPCGRGGSRRPLDNQ